MDLGITLLPFDHLGLPTSNVEDTVNRADSRRPSMFILPLMQGFVGQRAFTVHTPPDKPSVTVIHSKGDASSITRAQISDEPAGQLSNFLITLISRRSIKRPGLRYLRRGVNDGGDTANSVETEQILSKASWKPSEKVYSFTQIRGSIPLFFSQSPYSFKPIPVLQHSSETNHNAFRRHFASIMDRYGDAQIVLLVDKHGGEAEIGRKYEEHTREFNAEDGIDGRKLGFEWFDFRTYISELFVPICNGIESPSTLWEQVDQFSHEGCLAIPLRISNEHY